MFSKLRCIGSEKVEKNGSWEVIKLIKSLDSVIATIRFVMKGAKKDVATREAGL